MVGNTASRWAEARNQIDRDDGVICRSRLLEIGFSKGEIRGRLESDRLKVVFEGVYRLDGVVLGDRGKWRAAQLMSGSGVISHRSALALHGLIRETGPVDLVRTCGSHGKVGTPRRSRDGWLVRINRTRSLPPEDLTDVGGISSVCAERAVIDSARNLTGDELRSVLNQGERNRAIDFLALDRRIGLSWGRPGVRDLLRVRTALVPEAEMAWSEMEERSHGLIAGSDLPQPVLNVAIGTWIVDMLWPQAKLVVELDGFAYHRDQESFQRDRRKDRELREMGYTVLRFTWSEIVNEPEMVLATIQRFLAR